MNTREIVISKNSIYTITLMLVILSALVLFGGKFVTLGFGQPDNAVNPNWVDGSPEKFAFLSGKVGQRSVGST